MLNAIRELLPKLTPQECEALRAELGCQRGAEPAGTLSASPSPLLTVEQVESILHCSRTALWRWTSAGQLKAVHLGRRLLIDPADLLHFVQRSKRQRHKAGRLLTPATPKSEEEKS